jgi:excisionase family DNA binding protein
MTQFLEMLTEEEAARFLKVSMRTLQSWRVSGGGPTYAKFGRAVRYDKAQLLEWVASRTRANTSQTERAMS